MYHIFTISKIDTMKAIYVRISTSNQKTERQLTKRNEFDFVYIDVISGSVPFKERPEAQKLLNNEDIKHITINEVTRLGRNLSDILKTLQHFTATKINIHIENLGLNTMLPNGKQNPTANLMINLLGTIGQYERDLLQERTQQGREIAKAKGLYKGKPRGANADLDKYKAKHFDDINKVKKALEKGLNISETSQITSIPRTRIYRFINKGIIEVNS